VSQGRLAKTAEFKPRGLVVWTLGPLRCALRVGVVERVVPAMEL